MDTLERIKRFEAGIIPEGRMIDELVRDLAKRYAIKKELLIKDELLRFFKEGLIYIEEYPSTLPTDCGTFSAREASIRLRVKNDDYILHLEKQLASMKDHCEKCGCNEFLCGHNARGYR